MKLPAQSVRDRYKQTSGALDRRAKEIAAERGEPFTAESYKLAIEVPIRKASPPIEGRG